MEPRLFDRRRLRRAVAVRRRGRFCGPRGNVDGATVRCRWHDLERGAFASRPADTLVRHGVRRGFLEVASFFPAFAESAASRIVVSAIIVAGYTFLTAAELRRERRKSLIRRWPAIFVPMLHGAIFLFPVGLATLCCTGEGGQGLARGWIVVFAIEIVLYVVGTAFIVLILAKDRTVNRYKLAAATDP